MKAMKLILWTVNIVFIMAGQLQLHEGHMIHKDLPEGHIGVYVYQRERERTLRAMKLNCNN